jgi:hypothetical protein
MRRDPTAITTSVVREHFGFWRVEAIGLTDEIELKIDVVRVREGPDGFDRELAVGVIDLMEKLDDVSTAANASQYFSAGLQASTYLGHDERCPALDPTGEDGCVLPACHSFLDRIVGPRVGFTHRDSQLLNQSATIGAKANHTRTRRSFFDEGVFARAFQHVLHDLARRVARQGLGPNFNELGDLEIRE